MNGWIMPYIKQNKGRITLTLLFGFFGVLSAAMLLFVSGYLISKSSLQPENILLVYVPIVAVRAFSIGQAVFPYLDKLMSHDIVLRILAVYRKRLYTILEPQALFLESRYQTGDVLNVLADDIERMQDFFIKTLFPSIVGVIVYGVIAIVFGFFDWKFMLLMLLLLGIIVFLMPLVSYYVMQRQHLEVRGHRGKLYQLLTDAMFGKFDWLVSGREQEVLKSVAEENKALRKKENRIRRFHHFRDGSLRFVAGVVIILVMIWANLQVGEGAITPTVIAAFVLMMFTVTDELIPLSEGAEDIPLYREAVERIKQMEDSANKGVRASALPGDLPEKPVIELQEVSFTYEGENHPVIDQLQLTVAPGEKIAVLGKSGTGKSTLLKLLSGIVKPDAGKVMLDGIQMDASLLSQTVSVLNQKPHLFHTTIANNVRIGKPHASEEAVKAALKQAQILEKIESLPKGIHTQMDEMGKRFSGGERQRIALARVLIQDTPILLCDEPTTGLDPRTEKALLETILQAATDKTMIWVTHHLTGAGLMDKIIFLEDGGIKLSGSHQKLLETNEYYRRLFEMDQF